MGRKAAVARMLHRVGQVVTFVHEVPGTFDAASSTMSEPVLTTHGAKGPIQSYTTDELKDGTEILASDMKLIVPYSDFADENGVLVYEPEKGDRVIWPARSREFRVQNARLMDADKAFIVQLRGGGQPVAAEAS